MICHVRVSPLFNMVMYVDDTTLYCNLSNITQMKMISILNPTRLVHGWHLMLCSIDLFHAVRYCFLNNSLCVCDLMIAHKHVFMLITLDRVRSTPLITVTRSAHVCISLLLSYLFIVLMGHIKMVIVNIQYYFLRLDLIPDGYTCEIG